MQYGLHLLNINSGCMASVLSYRIIGPGAENTTKFFSICLWVWGYIIGVVSIADRIYNSDYSQHLLPP